MNEVCKSCKHSARCLPNEEYIAELFQTLARKTDFDFFDGREDLETQMQALRQRFFAEMPEGCPFLTPERRKLTEIHWQIINDELRVKLVWPKLMMGKISIGAKRV